MVFNIDRLLNRTLYLFAKYIPDTLMMSTYKYEVNKKGLPIITVQQLFLEELIMYTHACLLLMLCFYSQ